MVAITGLTRGETIWHPRFIEAIDRETCLGCGRCYKVCGRDVLGLQALNEDGEVVDEDEDDDEVERKVMSIFNADDCIGCGACSRICPKNCQSFLN